MMDHQSSVELPGNKWGSLGLLVAQWVSFGHIKARWGSLRHSGTLWRLLELIRSPWGVIGPQWSLLRVNRA